MAVIKESLSRDKVHKPTISSAKKNVLILVPLVAVLMLSYQNCAVDLSATTPGALVSASSAPSVACEPDAAIITDLRTIYLNTLVKTGNLASGKIACGTCHAGSSSNNGAKNFFLVREGGDTDDAIIKSLYCDSIAPKKDTVLNFPQGMSHSGGSYTSSDIPELIEFLQTRF